MLPNYYDRKAKQFFKKEGNAYFSNVKTVLINDGIPYFAASNSYASLFGDQWKAFKKTQLDSYSNTKITENRLDRCLGELAQNLNEKLVLEAGCGAGRFTEVLLKKNATLVSVDLSSAVEVNQENFPQSAKHSVIQADINDLPFENSTFDVVVCLGVIQHTPDSDKTIGDLFDLVKPGGSLVIDHYTYTKSNYFRIAPLYRSFLKTKSAAYTIAYTKKLVDHYLPWHKRFAKSRLLSILLNRISPVISYYRSLPELNEQMQ